MQVILAYFLFAVLTAVLFLWGFKGRELVWGRRLIRISYVFFLFLCLEIVCVFLYRIYGGQWSFSEPENYNVHLFEPHPYLVGVPKKDIQLAFGNITFQHNEAGYRGRAFSGDSGVTRIAAIGGSTTYGVGVSNNQTWPAYLDSLSGPGVEVMNFGVPGHSSVENLIQTALVLPEFQPDVVLIHSGLNDLRNVNIKGLRADYSGYHAPTLRMGLGFCYRDKLPRIATVKMLVTIIQKIGWMPECPYDIAAPPAIGPDYDLTEVLRLYRRNLENTLAMLQARGIKPVLIPQVLSYDAVKDGRLRWWIPNLEEEDLVPLLRKFNQEMENIAREQRIPFVSGVLNTNWEGEDFVDPSHLNPEANLEFARIIFRVIERLPQSDR